MKRHNRPFFYSMGPDYNVYAYTPAEWGLRRGFLQGLWPATLPALVLQMAVLSVPLMACAVLLIQSGNDARGSEHVTAGIAGLVLYGSVILLSAVHIRGISTARRLRQARRLPEPGLELPDTLARRWFRDRPGTLTDTRANFPRSTDLYPGERAEDFPLLRNPKPERSLFYATGKDRSVIHAYTPSEWGRVSGLPRDRRAAGTVATIILLVPGVLSPGLIAVGIGRWDTSVMVFGAVLTVVFSPILAAVYNSTVRAYGTAALRRRKGLPTPKFLAGDTHARQWFHYHPGAVPFTRANFPGSNLPFPGEHPADVPPFDVGMPPDVEALYPLDSADTVKAQLLRAERDLAMRTWHAAAISAGQERRIVRTRTGRLHSYSVDELGLKPAASSRQLTSWWGMALAGLFCAVFAAVLVGLGVSGTAPGAGRWVAPALALPFFGLAWMCAGYALDDYRARQRRRERGAPEPASR